MQTLGSPLPALPRDIVFVRDLEAFEGPILTEYRAVEGNARYLEKWCSRDGSVERWLIVRTEQRAVAEYLDRRISMRNLLLGPSDGIGFLVDRQGDRIIAVHVAPLSTLPSEYLPKPSAMHDEALRPDWETIPHSFLLGVDWDAGQIATMERRYLEVFGFCYFTASDKGRSLPEGTLYYEYDGGIPIVHAFRRIRSSVPLAERARSAGVSASSPGVLTLEAPVETALLMARTLATVQGSLDAYRALHAWSPLKPQRIEHLPSSAPTQLADLCAALGLNLRTVLPIDRAHEPIAILTAGKLVAAYYRRLWGLLEPASGVEFVGAGVEKSAEPVPPSIFEDEDDEP